MNEDKIERLKLLMTTPMGTPPCDREFGDIHEEVETLMGRPVWTHEFAFPELLYEELELGTKGSSFGKSLSEVKQMMPVGIVVVDQDSNQTAEVDESGN